MKKRLLYWVLCLPLLTTAQSVIKPASPKPDWATLADAEFSIRYPNSWTLDQTGLFGSNFFLYAPFDTATDVFRENFNLIINDLKEFPGISLAEIAEGARQQILNMVTDVKILEFKEVEEGYDKYYWVEYTGKQGEFNLHWKQHYRLMRNMFYVLTFTAEEEQYIRYTPLANQIFDSFFLK